MLHRPGNIMRITLFSGLFLAAGLAPALAVDPTGDWRVADGVANIRVAQCNGSMWAQSRCLETGQADARNADSDRYEEKA
jgi:hypothetical protein